MGGVGNVAVGGVDEGMERRGGMQKDLLVSFFKIFLVVVIIVVVAVGRKGGKESSMECRGGRPAESLNRVAMSVAA